MQKGIVDSWIRGLLTALAALLSMANPVHAQTCDPVPSGIVSWWSGESNAQDNFFINNGILEDLPGFGAGEVNLAFSFSGANQFVRVPDSPSLHFSNAMTLETWVYPTRYSSNSGAVLSKYGANAITGQSSWTLLVDRNGHVSITASTNGTADAATVFATSVCPLNTWTHLAATYDGTNLSIYFNGALQAAVALSGNLFAGTYDMGIGANVGGVSNNAGAQFFPGKIDEAAVYSRALSATEIQAIYTAGTNGKCQTVPPTIFAQPTNQLVDTGENVLITVGVSGSQPADCQWYFNGTNLSGATSTTLVITNVQANEAGTYYAVVQNAAGGPLTSGNAVLTVSTGPDCFPLPSGIVSWWSGEGNALDNFNTNNGLLVNSPSFAPGKVGLAFSFNATSFIRVTNSPSLTFSNAMTAEAWINPSAYKTMYAAFNSILSTYNALGAAYSSTYCLYLNTDGRAIFFLLTSAGDPTGIATTSVCPLNSWTHLAGTYDGTNMNIYFNGVLQSNVAMSGTISTFGYDLGIGATLGGQPDKFAAEIFSGLIDEPALYNRALTAAEIQGIYNAESSGKCPIPPAILVHPVGASADVGQSAGFSVSALGTQPLAYGWYLNGTNINGATNSALQLTNLQTSQAGIYYATVTSPSGGPIASSNAVLNIVPVTIPPPELTGAVSGNQLLLTFPTVQNGNYTVEYKTNLTSASWLQLTNFTASGTNWSVTDFLSNSSGRFYRIMASP